MIEHVMSKINIGGYRYMVNCVIGDSTITSNKVFQIDVDALCDV